MCNYSAGKWVSDVGEGSFGCGHWSLGLCPIILGSDWSEVLLELVLVGIKGPLQTQALLYHVQFCRQVLVTSGRHIAPHRKAIIWPNWIGAAPIFREAAFTVSVVFLYLWDWPTDTWPTIEHSILSGFMPFGLTMEIYSDFVSGLQT